MRARLARWLEAVRTGFWFLPLLMLACAAALALLLLHLDRTLDPGLESTFRWAYTGGPEGARSLLSTIAGSMITAASVTFSLASVALSIASQQYGSRVLRNFMRDRITQVLLGTFIATFIYSVLVVRAIRGSDSSGAGFVPSLSVTFALALSLVSLVLLVYFIHHVSSSIQASRIIRVISENIEGAIPRLYPSGTGTPKAPTAFAPMPASASTTSLCSHESGYLQTIDLEALLSIASETDSLLEILPRPGDHLLRGDTLLRRSGARSLTDKEEDTIVGAFFLDRERTPAQDIRYSFQQLTDVVIRALSPGINDPFTAINGVDELATALRQFARRDQVSEQRKDSQGFLRLIVRTPTTAELLEQTVGHISIYATSDRFVLHALERAVDGVVPYLEDEEALAKSAQLRSTLRRMLKEATPS